ncbi:hypothetical protein Celal_1496 [Cellulophaga algicola DSM 14237]|uniref:Uncharacterized protein n=1 Tax=Cellulophaga algicola (strain DSM 14237 / IC166 / ACAM 630) TaxID=688270 RepID=E6XAA9_CELAD|nr:hypothetical protein Celal_1496 [Cellulophaga algicola DSM 14237]
MLVKIIKKVNSYALKDKYLYISSGRRVYEYNSGLNIFKSEEDLQDLSNIKNNIFVNDIYGRGFIIEELNYKFLGEFIKITYQHYLILSKIEENRKVTIFKNQKTNEVLGKIKGSSTIFYLNLKYFFSKNLKDDSIESFMFPSGKYLWQFKLETLGKFEDRDGNLQNYEVLKFIGAWQNSIVVACSGQLVLDISSKTGELNRKWQALPGYGSSAFQGRLQHKLPSTDGFQLDISKSYLYHLAGAYLVTIDLVTGKANYQTLKNTLEEHVFSGFRWSTGYAEDENHIYTIAEMNRMELGLDYTPQCIVAFNKKTLKIDWHYRFEGDWVKMDIPQRSTNKLYQLSGDNTLYIFEKEEKSV